MPARTPTLHLMCGLPGSGKTTHARKLETELSALRFSPDEWLAALGLDGHDSNAREAVEKLQLEVAMNALRSGVDVILENGFWSRAERDWHRQQASAIGASTKIHYLDVPLDELKQRLRARNLSLPPGTFWVTPEQLDQWLPSFEPPSPDEL